MLRFAAIVGAVVGSALMLAVALAQPANQALTGTWRGTGTCQGAVFPLELRLGFGPGGALSAIQEFGTGDTRGVFQMAGRIERNGEIVFTPTNWVRRPAGYDMVGLRGRVVGETFEGRIDNRQCGAFSTRKVSTNTLPAPRPKAPPPAVNANVAADAPTGRWMADTTCRGRRVKLTVRIGRDYSQNKTARVHMAPFDGDTTTSLVPVDSWMTKLSTATADMMRFDVALDSVEQLQAETKGRRFEYYPVVFTRGAGGWTGRVEDPSCSNPVIRPEGPPAEYGESGRALTLMAWVGKTPADTFSGQTIWQFLRVDPNVFLTAAERGPSMRWAPGAALNSGMLAIAVCRGAGDCNSDPQRRVFFIEDPPSRYSTTQANFASAVGAGASQWCKYNPLVGREWRCTAIPKPFPAALNGAQLYNWMTAAAREEGAKWARANPAPGLERCAVQTVNGREERRVCQPVPGPPMPTYTRQ